MPFTPPSSRRDELLPKGHLYFAQDSSESLFQEQENYFQRPYSCTIYRSPGKEEAYVHDHQQEISYNQQGSDQLCGPVCTPVASPDTSVNSRISRTCDGFKNKQIPLSRLQPEGQGGVERSPRPKKVKKKIKAGNRVARLEKPLSELTKDWEDFPIVDIDAYVNRSTEERRREVEEGKVPGRVKRPMNSFMLYRKAYQNRTKGWCAQNNHQVVSQVCGDSWPLEPDSVKNKFNEWAQIERLNHKYAHPGYKFSPGKASTRKVNKRRLSEVLTSDESDLERCSRKEESIEGLMKNKQNENSTTNRFSQEPVTYSSQRIANWNSSTEQSVDSFHKNGNQISSYQMGNQREHVLDHPDAMHFHGEGFHHLTIPSDMHPCLENNIGADQKLCSMFAPINQVGPSPELEAMIDPNLMNPYQMESNIPPYLGEKHMENMNQIDHGWHTSIDYEPRYFALGDDISYMDSKYGLEGREIQTYGLTGFEAQHIEWPGEVLDHEAEIDKLMGKA